MVGERKKHDRSVSHISDSNHCPSKEEADWIEQSYKVKIGPYGVGVADVSNRTADIVESQLKRKY
jgi:hypothetical protein